MSAYRVFRKWSLFILNFIFLVVGGVLVGFGCVYVKNDLSKAIPPSYHYFSSIPTLLISIGTILILIAVFGSLGVYQKNVCFLSIQTTVLVLVFILHVVLTIITFVEVSNQGNLATQVNKTLEEIFNNNTDTQLVNHIHMELECCGTYGPKSWIEPEKIPKSCCPDEDCSKLTYTRGCQNELYYFLLKTVRVMGLSMMALSIVQVIAAITSLSLTNSIRNDERRYGRYVGRQID